MNRDTCIFNRLRPKEYFNCTINVSGVARTINKYAYQRETTGSGITSLFKMETSLKGKNLLPTGANSFL